MGKKGAGGGGRKRRDRVDHVSNGLMESDHVSDGLMEEDLKV